MTYPVDRFEYYVVPEDESPNFCLDMEISGFATLIAGPFVVTQNTNDYSNSEKGVKNFTI
jgi:hypothetical protein